MVNARRQALVEAQDWQGANVVIDQVNLDGGSTNLEDSG